MTEIPKPSNLGRLHILTAEEIQNLFELPEFTDEERLFYFSLSETEFELLAQFRSFASKLNFILQLGYFKARHLFFNFEFQTVSVDAEFIRRRYFPQEKMKIRKLEKVLENLLDDSVGFYEITNLKREPRDFGFSEIKREIERGAKIKEIYQSAKEILPILEISNQSIAYYASLVSYYRVDKLKRFENWTTYLYLLCFIHQRYQRVQENLINCLLYRIRLYTDQAKEFGKQKLSSINLTTNQNIGKTANVLRLLTDEQISSETPFGVIRQKAFEILVKSELEQFTELILEEIQLDEMVFRWEYLDKIAHQFKMNLRPLLLNVQFTDVADNSDLSKAINFLRQTFLSEQPLANIISNKFPLDFIQEKNWAYLFRKSKKLKKKQIHHNRYEFFVYQSLANALDAGDINCRESLKFRSFEDDLIDNKTWEQKEVLLEQLNLSILSQPIEHHLQELENQLEEKLKAVNQRISKQENESFNTKGSRWSLKYPTQNEINTDSFFDSMTQIDLYQVLCFVHQQTDLLGSFGHLRGKYVKQRADETVISACLMAWGTNTGLGRMSQISDFKGDILQVASENFIRPETLQNANDQIVDEIAKFDLFHQYNINETVHSSSDGQKFETRFHTINSRYSPKYFGLKKGIVAYILVANHIPINARIIGANEHESHYVFDVLFNNSTKIQPEIHSTDTHGSNQVNFALLHLFGYQFAPRFKDIYDTVTKTLYGFQHPSRYSDFQIKPIRKINQKLIIQEWENIKRIILSLANKATTQSIITRKLSSYNRTNQTKQALWEYDNIIRSLYLLDYIDSQPLRQNVQQALNRGESYHQLKRAISFANFGKLRFKSEYEQNIWNECSRLLTNCILYYNLTLLSEWVKEKEKNKQLAEVEIIKQISPGSWQHINFMGRYEFKQPLKEISIAKIIEEIKHLPLIQPQVSSPIP